MVPAPFFSAREIDLSIEWGALLDGAIVSEIDVYAPKSMLELIGFAPTNYTALRVSRAMAEACS